MSVKVTGNEMSSVLGGNKPQVFINRDLPVKIMYWFGRFQKKLVKMLEDQEEERIKIIKEFCIIDDRGNPKFDTKTRQFEWKAEGDREEADRKIKELFAVEIDFPFDKLEIKFEEIDKWNEDAVKRGKEKVINAEEMMLLMPFVDFKET